MSSATEGIYFGELVVEGLRCFREESRLSLLDRNGKPSMVNVILGNNGFGKTTLLDALEGMQPVWIPGEKGYDNEETEGEVASKESSSKKDSMPPLRPKEIVGKSFPLDLVKRKASYVDGSGLEMCTFYLERAKINVNAKSIGSLHPKAENFYVLDLRLIHFGASRVVQPEKTTLMPIDDDLGRIQRINGLLNPEEYFARLDYLERLDSLRAKLLKQSLIEMYQEVIDGFVGVRVEVNGGSHPKVVIETNLAKVSQREQNLGHQTMMAMVTELFAFLAESYPESSHPANECAVAMIDEIDLHLHPSWQQRILSDLHEAFPNVQFIVTTHSPLVVQNASDFNLAILEGSDGGVRIRNLQGANLQGWTVEEILENVMGVKDASSQEYLNAANDFERAINNRDYDTARNAYERLKGMLPSNSVKSEIMKLRIEGLSSKKAV